MALFEFEHSRVEDIVPWGQLGDLSLSWFALTDGQFRMIVGEQVLFRYTDAILSHWSTSGRDADYQIAAFARDILGSVAAAVAPLPPRIETLASNWELLTELLKKTIEDNSEADDDLWYEAGRWLGERSPWTSYLTACPFFQFVRIRDDLQIHWDNRMKLIEGLPVWTAQHGVHVVPVEDFLEECRAFTQDLLFAIDERIAGIEDRVLQPQVEVNSKSLREQHEKWRAEFASYFCTYKPDIPWEKTEKALLTIAEKKGLHI